MINGKTECSNYSKNITSSVISYEVVEKYDKNFPDHIA